VRRHEVEKFLTALDDTPDLGFRGIAAHAHPLVVHSTSLAKRLAEETGANAVAVPFVPFRFPSSPPERKRGAVLTIASFGEVSATHKRHDLLVEMMAWLRQWRVAARLVFVGAVPSAERAALDSLAADLGVRSMVEYTGRCDSARYESWLMSSDVTVHVRSSGLMTLSGAVLESLAFGIPSVTTRSMAAEVGEIDYVGTVPDRFSSFDLASQTLEIADRFPDAASTEERRQEFVKVRSIETYAENLAGILLRSRP
jgi:glycosyltransferase involved in cell wall biosynthesis